MTKNCTKCHTSKILSEFHKQSARSDGLQTYCKTCASEYRKVYRKENIDKIKVRSKQYTKENAGKIKEYYVKNIEKITIWQKEYNKEYNKKYQKTRRKIDVFYKLRCDIRSRIGQSMRKMGFKKNSRTAEILGCSYEDFKLYIEKQFTEGMNWNNSGEWHYDHIIPVSSAKTESEILQLNHYTNFQPLWAVDNMKKSNRF